MAEGLGIIKSGATSFVINVVSLTDLGGAGLADFDIVAGDTGKLFEVADELRESAKLLDAKIEEIYSLIASFPSDGAWSGATYVKFHETIKQYRPTLESLIDIINSLANICEEDISNDVIVLQSRINKSLGLGFERIRERGGSAIV